MLAVFAKKKKKKRSKIWFLVFDELKGKNLPDIFWYKKWREKKNIKEKKL